MIDDEDDDAASNVFDAMSDVEDDDEAVAEYTVAGDDEDAMFESKIKVVRDGKVKLIRKRLKKQRRTSKQKAALKKASRKSHTSTAKMHRRKSMKVRQKRGL